MGKLADLMAERKAIEAERKAAEARKNEAAKREEEAAKREEEAAKREEGHARREANLREEVVENLALHKEYKKYAREQLIKDTVQSDKENFANFEKFMNKPTTSRGTSAVAAVTAVAAGGARDRIPS